MAKVKPFREVQHEALTDGFIDALGTSRDGYEKVDFDDVASTLVQLAAQYISKITSNISARDVASSGKMADDIAPTEVMIDGTVYSIGVRMPDYASYQDEGVEGWHTSGFRGSRFKFKTRGVDPDGDHVKSIKEWLKRESSSAANVKVGISSREKKGMQLDAKTKAAVRTAYMIKRQGIEAKYFIRDATEGMQLVIQKEFGTAFRTDIYNTFYGK
jgi:hypothetical protein